MVAQYAEGRLGPPGAPPPEGDAAPAVAAPSSAPAESAEPTPSSPRTESSLPPLDAESLLPSLDVASGPPSLDTESGPSSPRAVSPLAESSSPSLDAVSAPSLPSVASPLAEPTPSSPSAAASSPSLDAGSPPSSPDAGAAPVLAGVRVALLNFREPLQSVAGGAEQYAWQVAKYLIGQGATVTFATSREPGQLRAERRDGIELRRMGNRYLVYLLVPLWLLLRRRRFDVVIDCMNGIPFFSPLVVRRRTAVISLVHHVHDRQFHAFFPRWPARFGCFIEGPVARLLYRRRTTVTVSESSRRELRERLRWIAPIQVIPNGSPATRPIGSARGGPGGDPAIAYLGRLVRHKRVERVVELAAELAETWPGLRVHVVGRGPERRRLAARARELGVADRVRLHGFLAEADKNAVLGGARLNVTASEFEGWGLTVIEAAALGVPTVAYDVAGLRDSVRHGETGWLVRDGERLADVVARALKELEDPVRRAEIQRACRAWAGEFTWGRTGARMTALIAAELDKSGYSRIARFHLAPGETEIS